MSIAKSRSRSNQPQQSGFYLLLLVTLVPVAFVCGWMAKGISEGGSSGLSDATDRAAVSVSEPHEAGVELTVELEMLLAQKKVMEDEIAEARSAGSGLDAIVEEELKRINEEIARLKQEHMDQKQSAATAEESP